MSDRETRADAEPDEDTVEDDEFAEFDVVTYCVKAIESLDEITQDRVVRWLHARYVEQSR